LDETQLREEGVLADELGIERNDVIVLDLGEQRIQTGTCVDENGLWHQTLRMGVLAPGYGIMRASSPHPEG
jgi:hypothetical protein